MRTPVNTGLSAASVLALAIDPATPTTLYAGTEAGGFKSTNGGGSWTAVNSGLPDPRFGATMVALVINPATPTTLYAGTDGDGEFDSTDGGASWTALTSG